MHPRSRLLVITVVTILAIGSSVAIGTATVTADTEPVPIDAETDTVIYDGQTATISVTTIEDEADTIVLVDPDGTFVREYVPNETLSIEPTDLDEDGEYELQGLSESAGEITATGDRSDVMILNKATSTLETTFAHDVRTTLDGDSAETTLTVDSNKAISHVTVNATGLTGDELAELFDSGTQISETEAAVALENGTATLTTTDIEPGFYTVTVAAGETTAVDTASLIVTDETEILEFADPLTDLSGYDTAAIDVNLAHTKTAYLRVTDESAAETNASSESNSEYEISLELTDTTGDGSVTVQIDTLLAAIIPEDPAKRCQPSVTSASTDNDTVSSNSSALASCSFDESAAFSAVGDDEVAVHSVRAGDRSTLPTEYGLSLELTPDAETEQDFGLLLIGESAPAA